MNEVTHPNTIKAHVQNVCTQAEAVAVASHYGFTKKGKDCTELLNKKIKHVQIFYSDKKWLKISTFIESGKLDLIKCNIFNK